MGTPEIARIVLEAIVQAKADDVVLVLSQPDRPKGRGKKLEPTPVKALALQHGLTVEQPKKLRDGAVAQRLRDLDVDLAIVVAYGRILPVDVFEAPDSTPGMCTRRCCPSSAARPPFSTRSWRGRRRPA